MDVGRPKLLSKFLKIEKKRPLSFNDIVATTRKKTKRHVRRVKPILRQTFFIDTAATLIDYTQSDKNIAAQAAKLYSRTMYRQPEQALEFAAIAYEYAMKAGEPEFAEAMNSCWEITQEYVIRSPDILPEHAAKIDSKKILSNTQYHVYKLLGQGKSIAEIAKMLGRTMHGVTFTVRHIKKRLKIRTLNQVRIHSRTVGKL